MTKLEIFGYSTLGIVLVIIAILIYLYINRFEVEERVKEFEYEDEELAEEAIYEKNDEFDWEVYESELKFNDEKFLGYDFWKNKLSAETRILEIKKTYSEDPNIIFFTMFEALILIERFGSEIILKSDGVFSIPKFALDRFVNELVYDVALIKLIQNIKDEYVDTTELIELDAK